MRVLFISRQAYVDVGDPGAVSMRLYARWLVDAGHEVQFLSGGVFRRKPDLGEALRPFGVVGAGRYVSGSHSMAMFADGKIKVNLICTQWHQDSQEATDIRTMVSHGQRMIRDFRPQLVVYTGSDRAVMEVVRLARNSASRVLGAVWNFGSEQRETFASAHRVLAGNPFLARHYKTAIGLNAAGYPPPVEFVDPGENEPRAGLLVLNSQPHDAAPAIEAVLQRGFTGVIRIHGAAKEWDDALPLPPGRLEFRDGAMNEPELWTGIGAVLAICANAAGREGAEALLRHLPTVSDERGPNPETAAGYGVFLDASPENGMAWAQAILDALTREIGIDPARESMRLYAPEVQRTAYIRLAESLVV